MNSQRAPGAHDSAENIGHDNDCQYRRNQANPFVLWPKENFHVAEERFRSVLKIAMHKGLLASKNEN